MYKARFGGIQKFRSADFQTRAGAAGWLRRNWKYVVENPEISHPDGTIERLPVRIEVPASIHRGNRGLT